MMVGGAVGILIGFFLSPMLLTPPPQTEGNGLHYVCAFIGALLGMAAGSDFKTTSKNLWKIIVMLIAYGAILAGSKFLPVLNGGQ